MSTPAPLVVTAGMLVNTTTLTAQRHSLLGGAQTTENRPDRAAKLEASLGIDYVGEGKAIAEWLKASLPTLTMAEVIKDLAGV